MEIETNLVEQLEAGGRYHEVSSRSLKPEARRDLSLVVKVLRLPKGGTQDITVFSEAEVKFEVSLIDEATGETIGSCIVEAEASSGGIWSRASSRAVDCAVEKVVEFITTG